MVGGDGMPREAPLDVSCPQSARPVQLKGSKAMAIRLPSVSILALVVASLMAVSLLFGVSGRGVSTYLNQNLPAKSSQFGLTRPTCS